MRIFKFENINQEKELAHLLILNAMSKTRLFKDITFQGGTSLRLCYMGDRYSEDLDFVVGKKIPHEAVKEVGEFLIKELQRQIQNDVEVQVLGKKEDSIIHKVVVSINSFNMNKQKNKILIELAEDIPARTQEYRIARSRFYPEISVYINTETIEEIFADKLIAFGGRTFKESYPFKARDVWDIDWITQRNDINSKKPYINQLVLAKMKDYSINKNDFINICKRRIESLNSKRGYEFFKAEMQNYLEENMVYLLNDELFIKGILNRVSAITKEFMYEIYSTNA